MLVVIKSLNELEALSSSCLPIELKTRIDNKKNKQAHRQSHLAYCLLLKTLKKEYAIDNVEIKFTPNGKPYIQNGPHFSIAHSDNYIAIAIDNNEVGIDIEKVGEFNTAIADKYFSASEKKFLFNGDKNLNFYKLWTAKEALIKKKGTGLRDLSDTELIPIPDGFRHNENLIMTQIAENYVISVCFSEKTDF